MSLNLHRLPGAPLAQQLTIRQHSLVVDEPQAAGGQDLGPDPHDLYDAALGACKSLTVLWYARKKGIAVDDVQTRIVRDDSQERAGSYRLRAELSISGTFSDAEFEQLVRVAEKCPIHKLMTSVTTEIDTAVVRQA